VANRITKLLVVGLLTGWLIGSGDAFGADAAPDAKKPRKRTIFSAPFENVTNEKQYDPAASGMGDLVAVMLAQQENITVVERQRLTALTKEQVRSLEGLTGSAYAITAGKLLKANTVLTGRLFLVKDKLTITIKAIDIVTERVVAADQISCRPTYLAEAALQVARKLGKQMALPLPKIDLEDLDKAPIASLHFAHALGHYYGGDMDAAIMEFMRTMDLDPDFTEVHYWMGVCYQRQGEDAHAVIEWQKLLKRHPDPEGLGPVKTMLSEAQERLKSSTVKRLGAEGEEDKTLDKKTE